MAGRYRQPYGPPLDVYHRPNLLDPAPTGLFVFNDGVPREIVRNEPKVTYFSAKPPILGMGRTGRQHATQAAGDGSEFGTQDQYGTSSSFTAIACCRPTFWGAGVVDGQACITADDGTGNTRGWWLGFTNTIIPAGLTFFVWKNGGAIQEIADETISSLEYGEDLRIAASYNSVTGGVRLYFNGRLLGTATFQTGSNNSAGAVKIRIGTGGAGGPAWQFDGPIYWAAVFDRVLGDGEVVKWMERTWEYDTENLILSNTASFQTQVGAQSILGYANRANFTTSLVAEAHQGGVGGSPAEGPVNFVTSVGAGRSFGSGVPTLAQFITRINVNAGADSLSGSSPVSFVTRVNADNDLISRPGGRPDILGNSRRYRR